MPLLARNIWSVLSQEQRHRELLAQPNDNGPTTLTLLVAAGTSHMSLWMQETAMLPQDWAYLGSIDDGTAKG